ncbi:MAG: LysM peptidoglycan-binding domain-containing protein, partial [Alistipes sp.]|nr:LysM peptidoglycan-binding domain-containing protein [Alistipes sp.]
GVTVKQICKWNNIKDPSKIRIGQKLEIFLK